MNDREEKGKEVPFVIDEGKLEGMSRIFMLGSLLPRGLLGSITP